MAVGSENDAVRIQKIGYRGPLSQEFRVRNHFDVLLFAGQTRDLADPFAGIDRNCTLLDNQPGLAGGMCDTSRNLLHIGEIGFAVAGGGSSDSNENYRAALDCFGE